MTDFTYAQLEALWGKGGGSGSTAPVAAAIAEAESSGNSAATSSNPDGGTNAGLWQLDTPGGKGAGYSVAQLENPLTNAQVAVQGSSDGSDWSAWATYVSGAYKQYLNGAVPAAATSGPSGVWYEPWTWGNYVTSAAGSAETSVEDWALHYGAIGLAVLAGLGLIVLGVARGAGHKAETAVQTIAIPAAAAAGA